MHTYIHTYMCVYVCVRAFACGICVIKKVKPVASDIHYDFIIILSLIHMLLGDNIQVIMIAHTC